MSERSITIDGHIFKVNDRYTAGHTVNENEAGALNQVRAENLRNNFASVVKKAKEEAGEGNEPDWSALEAEFEKRANDYEFGARSGGRIVDPVEREAKRIATDKVEAAIRAKYGKLTAVSNERRAELVGELAKREDIVAQAKANLEAAADIASDIDI